METYQKKLIDLISSLSLRRPDIDISDPLLLAVLTLEVRVAANHGEMSGQDILDLNALEARFKMRPLIGGNSRN